MFLILYLAKIEKSWNEIGWLTVYCGQGQVTFLNQCQVRFLFRVTQKGLGKTLKNLLFNQWNYGLKNWVLNLQAWKLRLRKGLRILSLDLTDCSHSVPRYGALVQTPTLLQCSDIRHTGYNGLRFEILTVLELYTHLKRMLETVLK